MAARLQLADETRRTGNPLRLRAKIMHCAGGKEGDWRGEEGDEKE